MINTALLAFFLQAFGIGIMLLIGSTLMAYLIRRGGLLATVYALTAILVGTLLISAGVPIEPTQAAIVAAAATAPDFWAAVLPPLGPYVVGRIGLALASGGVFAVIGIIARLFGWSPKGA